MAFKINHLHIKTSDPQKTVKWFVDNLGAKILAENLSAETVGFRVDLRGLRLNVTGFVKGQKLEQHYGMEHLALDTDDLNDTVDKIKASGARILEQRRLPDGRNVCFFEGPEGVRLEVMEVNDRSFRSQFLSSDMAHDLKVGTHALTRKKSLLE